MPIGTRKEEALEYLTYHAATEETADKYDRVNRQFQLLVESIWDDIPEGPGKTVAIRAIGSARMECNSAIANSGS